MYKLFLSLSLAGLMVSCGNNQQAVETKEAGDVIADSTGAEYLVDTSASELKWAIDKKLIPGHNGTVKLAGGSISMKDGNIVAGNFAIDMATIDDSDYERGSDSYNKLVGHLKSPDFFDVASYPQGKFEITNSEVLNSDPDGFTHNISGNLTIRDSVKNISFKVKAIESDNGLSASGSVVINRLLWGITYNSEATTPAEIVQKMGEKNLIKDELAIEINIKANKSEN